MFVVEHYLRLYVKGQNNDQNFKQMSEIVNKTAINISVKFRTIEKFRRTNSKMREEPVLTWFCSLHKEVFDGLRIIKTLKTTKPRIFGSSPYHIQTGQR